MTARAKKRTARKPARAGRELDLVMIRAAELVAAARRVLRFGVAQSPHLDRAATRCHEALVAAQGLAVEADEA